MQPKPLFIPLKTEYYEAFKSGEKHEEFRPYGPRWNENVCAVGRDVVISKGYGKANRMKGIVHGFDKRHASELAVENQAAVMDVYGDLDIYMAVITIADLEPQLNINENLGALFPI